MRLTLVQVASFASDWRRMRLTDDDLRALENLILTDPTRGKAMAGTGGLRKMRFAPPSRHVGKSGATRVGYAYFPMFETVYLIALYAKQDKDNLTAGERNEIQSVLKAASKYLARPARKG